MNSKNKNERTLRPRVVLVTRCLIFKKNGRFLLIKRSKNDYHSPGLWEFPGGKLDEGQDLTNALEREVLEETGLLVIPTERIVYTESQVIPKGKFKGMPYVVIIGIGRLVGGKIKLSKEHTDYRWVNIKEAYEMSLKEEVHKALIILEKKIPKK